MWSKCALSYLIVLSCISQVYTTDSGYVDHSYVNPETGKELGNYYKSFPRSVRSFVSPPPVRLMRNLEGRSKLSPLLGLEEGEEGDDTLRNGGGGYDPDLDCIPNDGSDTGELHMGSFRSSIGYGQTPAPYKPKKDDCYGVYSPRCKMFNRFTSAYRAEQAEHNEVGFRRRRQNPKYNPVSVPYNSRPSHLALLRPSRSNTRYQPVQPEYGGIPDMMKQRFKRDLGGFGLGMRVHGSYGFPASTGFGGRKRRVPLSPKRVEADTDYSLPPSHNSETPTSNPGRKRIKCPERRVRPEYAYWKTRLSEDIRRREILKGSKKIGALRRNQHVMGRSSDPSWFR